VAVFIKELNMTESTLILLLIVGAVAIFLVTRKDKGQQSITTVPDNLMDATAWEIGPIIGGQNLSVGMPLNPSPHPEGFAIDIPYPNTLAGHAHYITVPVNGLAGKSMLKMTVRLEMDEGTKLVPVKSPNAPSLLTMYFQQRGDNWSGTGPFETYRQFASFATRVDLKAGVYTFEVSLSSNWTAIQGSSKLNNPAGFQAAMDNACRVGFVLGGGDGLGHGVYATAKARLVVTEFKII
jgi:hypothetical protein